MTNLFRGLIELLPKTPLTIGEVVAVHGDDTSTVQYLGGGQQRVRGTGFAVAAKVFVRAGVIEGVAPSLAAFVVEV
jgi:cation transporter-like permease